ncbi:MAG: glucose-6-phosphate isomerase [Clostridiales bacterium]|jgi:glucose-6-phosphate isomerase|nr:glucose-6-phosphate isomerase [Clostridiales bacterium]
MLKFSYENSGITQNELVAYFESVSNAHKALHGKTGAGNEFTGWVDLPSNYDREECERIRQTAEIIRGNSDVLLVCGIGGSYLGARAGIEFLKGNFHNHKQGVQVYFIGNNLSPDYLGDLLDYVRDKRISVCVVSKSGTTLEPAAAFRFARELMESKYGKTEAAERIYAITDREKGALKKLADASGYATFAVPDDIGGRYSVLTAVGLLPLAVAGADIAQILEGAQTAAENFSDENVLNNMCYQYAAIRNILLGRGKNIEILAGFEPSLRFFAEWWKQLFGESEGKNHKGIFPASVEFSTDLHSLGQYIQDGTRNIFETVLKIGSPNREMVIPSNSKDGDGLDFLDGKNMSFVNEMARQGTVQAHEAGGVPNLLVEIPKRDENSFGQLVYFFEKACAISGYLLGVNPFDQPGVEEYKKKMYALLKSKNPVL